MLYPLHFHTYYEVVNDRLFSPLKRGTSCASFCAAFEDNFGNKIDFIRNVVSNMQNAYFAVFVKRATLGYLIVRKLPVFPLVF